MLRRLVPLTAILAAACAPQSATLTEGSVVAYFGATTSFSLITGEVNPDDFDTNWNIDCRDLSDDERELFGLEDPLDICGGRKWPPTSELWMADGAYRAIEEDLEPWRGEGIMTGEGDFYVSFHHRITGGSDMRFGFAVDPVFQPKACVQNGENVELVDQDGNWLENWSADLAQLETDTLPPFLQEVQAEFEGGTLYYLNAGAYQIEPLVQKEGEGDCQRDCLADACLNYDDANFWSLPNEWMAGFARGKISEEDVTARTTRYAEPIVYYAAENDLGFGSGNCMEDMLWFAYGSEPGSDVTTNDMWQYVQEGAVAALENSRDEFTRAHVTHLDDGVAWYQPLLHENKWRPVAGSPADGTGLDRWIEMHYNWVVISDDSTLETGGNAKGAFSLVLEASESSTRMIVQGKFEVPKIKKDTWTTRDLPAEKMEENNTQQCGQ